MATNFDDLIGETLAERFANRPGNADEGGSDDAPARRSRDDAGDDGDGRSPGDGERGDESTTERRARRRLERSLQAERRRGDELQELVQTLGGRLVNVERVLIQGHAQSSARSVAERVAAAQRALEKAKDDVDIPAEVQAQRELNNEALLEEADVGRTARAQAAERAAPARTETPQRANPDRDSWLKRHKTWFDPEMKDLDSEIAGTISQRLLDDGYGHDDPEHYERLDAELKKRMPHLFKGKGGRSQDPDNDPDDDRDALPRSSGGDRTYGNGGRSDRGGDDGIPPPSREFVALWAQQNRGFDPKKKEDVTEMRQYWADTQRKRRR